MAPSRGRARPRGSKIVTPSRRAGPSSGSAQGGVPDVYQEMLNEAATDALFEDPELDESRPLKRRRIASSQLPKSDHSALQAAGAKGKSIVQQTAEASSSEDEDESDVDFEDVDLDIHKPVGSNQHEQGIADVSITIEPATSSQRRTQPKRRPASASEKAFRILVHKKHLLCLLGHCMYVNSRCNNEKVQSLLRKLVPKKTIAWLNHPARHSQFDRDRVFIDGLKQVSELFRGAFMVTESGMQRARWHTEDDELLEPANLEPLDLSAFLTAAEEMKGSQDTGNQLFCAMLRSIGVEARVVCSLQCLPLGRVAANSSTPARNSKPVVFATAIAGQSEDSGSNTEDKTVRTSATIGKVPAIRRRLGQPTLTATPSPPSPAKKKKPMRKLAYPVFWVEAFNSAYQQWIAVDPIVTQTISKQPTGKLEPPSSYEFNQMAYVFAFESDGVVRDVTRRYAKAFNAKTRRLRVESLENGGKWLKKALRFFRRRGGSLDRDAIEDAELAKLEAKEGLPGNVLDYKDHPYYALERHLRRHEVVHPKREVGKVNAGTAAKPRMEVVYRRTDVCECRSAERWFRLGREIIKGEVPVKRVPGRRQRRTNNVEDDDDDDESTMPLYASFQTELYIPAPIINGKVPRNAYGNLDIYVPSMVPAGGTHIRHQLAAQASRILKIDFADAVTGFQFKGRHGTAVIEGAVVAEEYADAVRATIDSLQDERAEEDSMARSAIALRMWKRFLIGLRIKERVSAYGDGKGTEDVAMEIDAAEEAGGFFPGEGDQEIALPTAGRFSLDELMTPRKKQSQKSIRKRDEESDEEAEFTAESDEEATPTISMRSMRSGRKIVNDNSGDEDTTDIPDGGEIGGGFIPESAYPDAIEEGGGFLPNDKDEGLFNEAYDQAGGFLPEEGVQATTDAPDEGGFLVGDEGCDDKNMISQQHVDQLREPVTSAEPAMSYATRNPYLDDRDAPRAAFQAPQQNSTQQPQATSTLVPPQELGSDSLTSDTSGHNLVMETAERPNEEVQSDHGSMLSHDPEDEDAEPDWLISDSD